MKKVSLFRKCITGVLLGVLTLSFAACGAKLSDTPSEADVSGTYTFEEVITDEISSTWTVDLAEDGSYVVATEFMGNPVEIKGTYTVEGDTVTTGAPEETVDIPASWLNEDQSCEWTLDIEAKTIVPVNYTENAGLAGDGADAKESNADYPNVSYASVSDSEVMDIYLPKNPTGSDPVIVVVHGGGFKFGDQNMEIIQPIIEAGVENGYVVASVDYRKSDEEAFPGAVADVKAAVRYIKANAQTYGIDKEKVVIWGESAGAYLSLMTALTSDVSSLDADVSDNAEESSSVNALVSFYAPVEFSTMDEEFLALGEEDNANHSVGSFETDFLGIEDMSENEELVASSWWYSYASSINLDEDFAAWIQAGTKDVQVPYTQSENFAKQLGELIGENQVSFSLIEGAGHEDEAFYTEENLADVFEFLTNTLQ